MTRNGPVQKLIAGVLVGAGAIVVACGGDDATNENGGVDAGGDATASSGSSGSTSSASSSGGSTSSTSSGVIDGGATDAATEGGGDGGKKQNGEDCAASQECLSNECFIAKNQGFCSAKCTMVGETDPVCEALGAAFTGKCNGKGYCQRK